MCGGGACPRHAHGHDSWREHRERKGIEGAKREDRNIGRGEGERSKEEEVAGVQRDDRSSRDVQAAASQVPKGTGQTWRTVTDLIGRKLYVDYSKNLDLSFV